MKKYFFFFLFSLFFLASCKQEAKTDDTLAGRVAKEYYDYLLKGQYDAFVDGTWRKDSIEAGYRQELINNAKMFVGDMKEKHQGLKTVDMKSVDNNPDGKKAIAFLILHFGDGTQEQVAVPMVKQEDNWYME